MADGFRVTEDGTRRVTESSDFRITEKFNTGAASLTAEGTVTAVANTIQIAEADLISAGSKLSAAVLTVFGHADLQATGTIQANGTMVFDLSKQLDGVGSLTAQQSLILNGLSDLNGSGTLDAIGFRIFFLEADLSASGSLDALANQVHQAAFFSGLENAVRITEEGDRRVTEDGSVRITDEVLINGGEGTIIVFGDQIPFTSTPFVKVLSNWRQFTPFVKYEDNWQVPDKIYKNLNGNWKRIF